MGKPTKYNAKDCSVMLDGTYITGLGEDMISWSKDEAYGEFIYGAQGDAVWSETNNDLHTLEVTVQPTCPQLPLIIKLMKSGDFFPVRVINKALGIRLGGEYGKIVEAPEIALGASAEDITVTIAVADGKTETI